MDPQIWDEVRTCRDPWGGTMTAIDVDAVPEPLRTRLWLAVKNLVGRPMSNHLLHVGIDDTIKAIDPDLRRWLKRDPADPKGCIVSFTLGSPIPLPEKLARTWKRFVEHEGPRITAPGWERRAVNRVAPKPVAGCSGAVTLDVLIGGDGHVAEAYVADGPEALHAAALEAARQWTFRTPTAAGHVFQVETRLRMEFSPTEQGPSAPSDT